MLTVRQTYLQNTEKSNSTYGDTGKQRLHNMPMVRLWEKIREARRAADLTQADLAAACQVSRNAVALWESKKKENRTKPTLDHLEIVAELTNRPISWFFEENGGSKQRPPILSTTESLLQAFVQLSPKQRQAALEAASKSMSPKGMIVLAQHLLERAVSEL